MTSSVKLRRRLVAALQRSGHARSPGVLRALSAVPRELFVPEVAADRGLAAVYADDVLVTKERDGLAVSASSQPAVMAAMLEALDLRPGQQVLEVGLGSGYNAALLARLVGDGVTSVDVDDALVGKAAEALRAGNFPVTAATGDGRQGWPDGAPYDRIMVTASSDRVWRAWWEQLRPGGRLVLPLRLDASQAVVVFTRTDRGFSSAGVVTGSFMPLRDEVDDTDGGVSSVTVAVRLAGQEPTTYTAYGPALARLSGTARTAFVGHLLSRPTRSRVATIPAFPVLWHTVLCASAALVHVSGMPSGPRVCLVDSVAGSFAALVVDVRDPSYPVAGVETYGDATAQRTELLDGLRDWRAAGLPELDRLAFEVRYPTGAGAPNLRDRRTWRRGDHRIHVGWTRSG